MALLVIIHSVIALMVIYALIQGPRKTLWLCGLLLPLGGLVFSVGVSWSWTRLLPGILLMALVLSGRWRAPKHPILLAVAAAWALFHTAFVVGLDPELAGLIESARRLGWGPAQTDYRHLVQGVVFVGNIACAPLAAALTRSAKDRDAVWRGFLLGAMLSASFGLYQCSAAGLGLPWPSGGGAIGRALNGNLGLRVRLEHFQLGPLDITRLYGLGGEPKHTAGTLVIALLLIASRALPQRRPLSGRFWILLLAFLATLSTSGWVAGAIGALTLALATIGQGLARRLTGRLALASAFAGMLLALWPAENSQDLFQKRVVGRLAEGTDTALHYEPKEAALFRLWARRPEKLVTGMGLGGADFFTIWEMRPSERPKTGTVTPTYTVTRLLGEVGLVGLATLILVCGAWIRFLSRPERPFFLATGLTLLLQPAILVPTWLFLLGVSMGERQSELSAARARRPALGWQAGPLMSNPRAAQAVAPISPPADVGSSHPSPLPR